MLDEVVIARAAGGNDVRRDAESRARRGAARATALRIIVTAGLFRGLLGIKPLKDGSVFEVRGRQENVFAVFAADNWVLMRG